LKLRGLGEFPFSIRSADGNDLIRDHQKEGRKLLDWFMSVEHPQKMHYTGKDLVVSLRISGECSEEIGQWSCDRELSTINLRLEVLAITSIAEIVAFCMTG
jgi:hypothetical protein